MIVEDRYEYILLQDIIISISIILVLYSFQFFITSLSFFYTTLYDFFKSEAVIIFGTILYVL